MSTEDALDRYISPPWDPRPDRAFSPIELSTNPTGEGTAGSLSTPYSLTGGDLPRGRKRNADEMESDAPTSSSRVIAPHDYRLTPSGSTVSSESATADTIFWEYLQGVTFALSLEYFNAFVGDLTDSLSPAKTCPIFLDRLLHAMMTYEDNRSSFSEAGRRALASGETFDTYANRKAEWIERKPVGGGGFGKKAVFLLEGCPGIANLLASHAPNWTGPRPTATWDFARDVGPGTSSLETTHDPEYQWGGLFEHKPGLSLKDLVLFVRQLANLKSYFLSYSTGGELVGNSDHAVVQQLYRHRRRFLVLGSRDHYILLFLERTLIFVSPIFIRDPEVNGATGDLSDRSLAGMGITLTAPERERMFSSITPLRVLTAMLAPLELGAEMVWPNWLNLLGRKASDSEDAADAEEAPESRDKSSGSGKKTKKTGDSERSEGSLDRSTVAPAELTVVAPDVCGWGDDVHPRLVISAHEVDAKARLVVGDYISRGRTFSTFKAVLSTPEADVQVVAKFAGLPRAWARQSEKREFTSQRRARAHAVHEAELLSGPLRELQGRAVPRFFGLWANVDSDLQSCPRIERLSDLGWDFDQESDEEEDEASYLLTVMEYLPEYEGAVSYSKLRTAYRALHAAHVAHRDVELRHIRTRPDGSVALIDFEGSQWYDTSLSQQADLEFAAARAVDLRAMYSLYEEWQTQSGRGGRAESVHALSAEHSGHGQSV